MHGWGALYLYVWEGFWASSSVASTQALLPRHEFVLLTAQLYLLQSHEQVRQDFQFCNSQGSPGSGFSLPQSWEGLVENNSMEAFFDNTRSPGNFQSRSPGFCTVDCTVEYIILHADILP